VKEAEMAVNVAGMGEVMCTEWETLKRRDHLGDLGVVGRIILNGT
jgi:hypothetical protein